jgi:hypothetical protein
MNWTARLAVVAVVSVLGGALPGASGAQYAGFSQALAALTGECAKLIIGNGTDDAPGIANRLWNATVTIGATPPGNGPVQFVVVGGILSWTGQSAYTDGTNIELNKNVFPDPTANLQTPTGVTSYLALVNSSLGTHLRAAEFGTFVFLHELTHMANGRAVDVADSNEYNKTLIDTCIKN